MLSANSVKKLQEYFRNKPIKKAWIFGSYARGEQTPDSDIDILVDFDTPNQLNLFSIAEIIIGLEELFGKKVDMVDHNRVYPEIAQFIEKDKILIYERNRP